MTLLCAASNGVAAKPSPPNIVVILADDMGFSDIGCFGSEICTPNIDRLAAGGIRFTQFYNCARCNPSRAALLTGRYPHQAGVGFATRDLGVPGYLGHLSRNSVTIAEVLRGAGYRTLMSGKWHLGDERPNWPVDRGFDRFFGLIGGAAGYWEVLPGKQYRLALNDQLWTPPAGHDFYFTDAVTEHALQFIGEAAHDKKPFFLYLAYTAPHWPLHAPAEEIAKYRGTYQNGWDALRESRHSKQIKLGVVDPRWALPPRERGVPAWDSLNAAERDAWDLRMAVYAAMIDRMDQGIGRVMEKLRLLGQHDNTLVLFLSDNGACEETPPHDTAGSDPNIPAGPRGGFWGYGPPWANASNTPFRRYKRFIHEGGISTPLICYWPAGIKQPDRLDRQPGHFIDLMPTLLEVAGARYPATFGEQTIAPAEGLSFAPVFGGQPRREHAYLFWEHVGNRGVRAGDWKLVSRSTGGWELYNIVEDRTELTNRAVAFPEKVKDLAARYDRWAAEVGVLSWDEVNRRRGKSE